MTISPLTSNTSPTQTAAASLAGSTDSSSNPLLSMSSGNTFLQLLVAQLKYQDPMNPTDPTQFMSQTAQMSEAANMASLIQSQQALLSDMGTLASTSMIGKQVTAKLADGSTVSGVVTSVGIEASGPVLNVGNSSVPLGSVTSVTDPSASSTASGSTSGSTTTPTSGTSTSGTSTSGTSTSGSSTTGSTA